MHEIETRRPCHHEPLGLTDADCCRFILAAGADALGTCRACRRGQALARTTGLDWLLPLPPVLPVPGMRALETGRVVEEEVSQLRRPKRRVAMRTVKWAGSDARPVRASTVMGAGAGMSTDGGSGNRWGDLTGAATGPTMLAHGGMNEMDDRADMPGAGAALPLDDDDWQAPWEELVMPEPEGLESEDDMEADDVRPEGEGADTEGMEEGEGQGKGVLQKGPNEVRELEEMRTALASALALVVAGFGAPGPVNLLPLLRIWPLFHPADISLPELELLCGACGLKLAPVGRDLHAVIIDSAYDKLVMEVSWPIKRPS